MERWPRLFFDGSRKAERVLDEGEQSALNWAEFMGVGSALEHTYDCGEWGVRAVPLVAAVVVVRDDLYGIVVAIVMVVL